MKSEIEVPDGWFLSKLSDLCIKTQSGGTPKSTIKEYYHGDIPFVKVEDLTIAGKNLYKTKTRITKEGLNNSSSWVVPKNSILYSMYASIGILSINRIGVATNQAILNLIVDSKKCSLEYLYYFLLNYKRQLNRFISETTQKNLNAKKVRNFDILLSSSMNEQQKIADILSKVDEQIDSTERIIDKTEELKKGLMQKLLTKGIGHTKFKKTELGEIPEKWEIKKMSEISKKISVGIATSTTKHYTDSSGVPLLRNQNILEGAINYDNLLYITKDFAEKNKIREIMEGDVISIRTGYPGISAVVPNRFNYCHTFTTLITRLNKNLISPYYLVQYLNSTFGKKIIKQKLIGSAQQNLNVSMISKIDVILPPLNEQKQIASTLSKVDEQIQDNKKELKHLQELKKGLMQDLLTGKVRVSV